MEAAESHARYREWVVAMFMRRNPRLRTSRRSVVRVGMVANVSRDLVTLNARGLPSTGTSALAPGAKV